jgi:NAD(P)-dependent dehydrogenase (short-subunit alcohol dehydrogenase family)
MTTFSERYRGRPVLVTGSSRGIGAAVAELLHDAGASVIGCARVARSNTPFPEYTTDVRDAASVAALATQVRKAHGALDLVVHCAGVLGPRRALVNVDVETFREVVDINLVGSFLIATSMYPLLTLGASPLLVLMSSSVGRRGRATWGPYAVSKHGVEGLSTTLADEWHHDQIGVWCVNPGGTATPMRAEAMPDEDPTTLPTAHEVGAVLLKECGDFDLRKSGLSWDIRDVMTD